MMENVRMRINFIDVLELFRKFHFIFISFQIVNFCDDCPVLDRLYDMCISYTSGSVGIIYSI